ncbi:MAG: CFI-box-CTERM domain-containing protein [Candidatus Nitrosomaritimum yanchengensis]
MRIYFLALTIIVVLGILLSINVEAKTTTFNETIQCQQSSNCKSVFEITEGSNVRLTISVPTQDEIKFKVENPNGKDVRLNRSSFPDSVGMTQIFTRTMTADITGEYTLSFLEPLPKNFRADISVVIDSAESVKIQDIPAAGTPNFKGGCLIATATYGSELAPQVQQLRELRDNKLLQTQSGSVFMERFNQVYYFFSPTIADYERENPVFKKTVQIAITPMISTLSILNNVDMDSEAEVLGYGISLILLNVGMYAGIPAVVVIQVRKQFS